ncbi:MAG: hypothetical protein ACOYBW_00615 [Fluviibacter phosphoraccumulans]
MLRILVICTANICRSPMAEYLLKEALRGQAVHIASAGIHGQPGIPADPIVSKMLAEQGINAIEQHQSQAVVTNMIDQFDLYLCMEQHHLDELQIIMPSVTGRAYLFGHWTGQEIADPHQLPEAHYLVAHAQIIEATRAWVSHLPRLGLL